MKKIQLGYSRTYNTIESKSKDSSHFPTTATSCSALNF